MMNAIALSFAAAVVTVLLIRVGLRVNTIHTWPADVATGVAVAVLLIAIP